MNLLLVFLLSFQINCNISSTPNNIVGPNGDIIDQAEDIAEEDVQYTDFPDGSQAMAERDLYYMLDHDNGVRVNRPILNSFYLAEQQDILGQLYEVDVMIAELTNETIDPNSAQYANILASAKSLNSQIVSNEVFETNERWMNTLYLDMLTPGWTHYDATTRDAILQLAADCPYLGGFGVYKARMLASDYVPNAYYDDLWICNNLGVYKNGNTQFAKELNSLKNLGQAREGKSVKGDYKVYPNPATTVLSIQYIGNTEMTAETFNLYDMTGKRIMSKSLSADLSIIDLPILAKGIYTYTISAGNSVVQRDKLLIE